MGGGTCSLYDSANMNPFLDLRPLGWDDARSDEWARLDLTGLTPARVRRVDRGVISVWIAPNRQLRATTATSAARAVTGDWVALDPDSRRCESVLDRRSEFVRRAARGAHRAQAIVANVDVVGVCQSVEYGVAPRRLERELVLAFQSGARPVVVLTKADLVAAEAIETAVLAATPSAVGCEVVVTSVHEGRGIDQLREVAGPGTTLALLGASGVGKSALVNTLVGHEAQLTGEVRSGDSKGRHTTTASELIWLGDRSIVDTPGMRALALWEAWDGVDLAFPEVAAGTTDCRFDDCTHRNEPDCAVRSALAAGRIDPERYEHWCRLLDELAETHPDES